MANDLFSINLIKKNKSFFEEFIRWTFTVGRVIIILTELIALSAFLYRFSLDRQLIDLHDEIENKRHIVANSKNNEEKFRNLQERLALIATLDTTRNSNLTTIQDVVTFASSDIIIQDILASETSIKMTLIGKSVGTLSSFVNALKLYKQIQSISIDKIENKPSQGIISITITGNLAQKTTSLFELQTTN